MDEIDKYNRRNDESKFRKKHKKKGNGGRIRDASEKSSKYPNRREINKPFTTETEIDLTSEFEDKSVNVRYNGQEEGENDENTEDTIDREDREKTYEESGEGEDLHIGRKISSIRGGVIAFDEEISRREREIAKQKERTRKVQRETSQVEKRIREKEDEIVIIKRKIIDFDGTGIDYNPEAGILVKKVNAIRPEKGYHYFSRPEHLRRVKLKYTEKEGMAIGIPFYNEPSHELEQALISLHNSLKYLRYGSKKWRNKPIWVNIIQDGWHKAHPSMKRYLQKMFPYKKCGKDWWEYYEQFHDGYNNPNDDSVFIFEKQFYEPVIINPQDVFAGKRKFMRITLLIKINNRKKHNSHEWFLGRSGFAEAVNAEYLFLTDAFTYFNETCLYHLVHHLDRCKNVSAVTGRQRLMTRRQQGTSEHMFSIGYMLRMVQLYDFEMANAVYNGAFSLGGFLPVIPGPCGMYRASDILQDKPRDWYFGVVNEEPDKTGLVLGNLRIAEDRILSYSSVMKVKGQKKMAFNPLAIFYFEAETDLMTFVLQRRRWINGSVAGYIYMLFKEFSNFREWDAPLWRKVYIWFLMVLQFLIYCLVGIAPGISLKILYFGVQYFLDWYDINFLGDQYWLFGVGLWVLYLAHVIVHHQNRFNYILMYMFFFISMITTVISFASLLHYFFVAEITTPIKELLIQKGGLILATGVFVLIVPFLNALVLSGKWHSLAYMFKSFIPYFLLTHLMISWFGSYAYSRIWDLSWGNRPGGDGHELSEEQRKFMQNKFKERSMMLIIFLVLANTVIFLVPVWGVLALMTIFYLISGYTMILSFIFCIGQYWYKVRFALTKFGVGIKKRAQLFKSYKQIDIDIV